MEVPKSDPSLFETVLLFLIPFSDELLVVLVVILDSKFEKSEEKLLGDCDMFEEFPFSDELLVVLVMILDSKFEKSEEKLLGDCDMFEDEFKNPLDGPISLFDSDVFNFADAPAIPVAVELGVFSDELLLLLLLSFRLLLAVPTAVVLFLDLRSIVLLLLILLGPSLHHHHHHHCDHYLHYRINLITRECCILFQVYRTAMKIMGIEEKKGMVMVVMMNLSGFY